MTGVICDVFCCKDDRKALWEEQAPRPSSVTARVAGAGMQAVRIPRPELDDVGHDAEAAPKRRPRYGAARKPRGRFPDARLELCARRQLVALLRRPRADLIF